MGLKTVLPWTVSQLVPIYLFCTCSGNVLSLHTYGKMPPLLSSAVSHVKLFATSSANLFCNRLGGIFPVEECMFVDLY